MRSLTHASFDAVSATVEGMSRQETPDYCALYRSRYEAVLRHFESLRHTGVASITWNSASAARRSWEEGSDVDEISGLRGLLVGKEQSLAERMRRRRWNLVTRLIPDLTQLRVLDLGGTGLWWARAPTRPREVTVINLDPGPGVTGVKTVRGDVLEADQLVGDDQFDLVFSNSLIEHLRGHSARVRFAELTTSLAPRYVVQTPYRYFPIEPHWIFPCFQFLPLAVGARVAPLWPLGHTRGWDARAATDEVMSTHLLSASEMSFYFPQAHIAWERVAGLRKSMFAVG